MDAETPGQGLQPDRVREIPPGERKARAGLLLATSKDRTEAALKAGYAPATVKNLTANGLTAEEMEKAARERYPREFRTAARSARSVNEKLLRRLDALADDPAASEAAIVTAYRATGEAAAAGDEPEQGSADRFRVWRKYRLRRTRSVFFRMFATATGPLGYTVPTDEAEIARRAACRFRWRERSAAENHARALPVVPRDAAGLVTVIRQTYGNPEDGS